MAVVVGDDLMARTNPVCVGDEVEYRILENGIYLIELAYDPPEPYKMWLADLWMCPVCGHKLVHGYGHEPKEHFEQDFNYYVERAIEKGTVVYQYELRNAPSRKEQADG